MNHTGELFLESAENRHSLNKWLHVTIASGQPVESEDKFLIVIEEAILDLIGKHVGIYLDDNFQSLYSANSPDFIKSTIHKEVINSIVTATRNGITSNLKGRGVVGFEITDSKEPACRP